MVPASGSHTGRVTPRVTLNVTSLAVPESASIRSTPRSRSAWRFSHAERFAGAWGGDAIDPLAAMHDADAERAVFRRHAVDGDDLARHLADRGAAGRECGAGMARLACRFEIEPRDRVAPGHDAVVRPARLRHQHIFVACGLGLDDVSGRGRGDFLIR